MLAIRIFISETVVISTGMGENGINVELWFNSLADEGLGRNYRSECTWRKYKDDLEETKKILSWLPMKLKHDVMVPIGSKALMRGKILHTNELLVNLGETWFVKKTASQTVDVCNRRIQECDRMLDKLKKERELLESKKSLPVEKEAFGSEERPEIVEFVSEEEYREWKKQHRIKEREYRQKLMQIRNRAKKPVVTEEDLWIRLDELELREELEDELNRLNAETDEEDEDEEENENEREVRENEKTVEDKHIRNYQDNNNISNTHTNQSNISGSSDIMDVRNQIKSRKLSVSFALDTDNSTDPEPLMLEIKHSSVEPEVSPFHGAINSPGDIYQAYLKTLNPKSILKCSMNVNQEKELEAIKTECETEVQFDISSSIVLPDVFARNTPESGDKIEMMDKVSCYKEPPKRISKFKASRMKKS